MLLLFFVESAMELSVRVLLCFRFERARLRFLESLQANRIGLMRPVPAAADKVLVPMDAAAASEWRLCSPVVPFLRSVVVAAELGFLSTSGPFGGTGSDSLTGWSGDVADVCACNCVPYVSLSACLRRFA